jgi:hypothetical protein
VDRRGGRRGKKAHLPSEGRRSFFEKGVKVWWAIYEQVSKLQDHVSLGRLDCLDQLFFA